MKQQTKFHCEIRDKRFTKDKRTLKGQDLNSYPYWNSYRSKIHTNPPEIHTDKKLWMNIPLWDMRQKIQFDIKIWKQDLNYDKKFIA